MEWIRTNDRLPDIGRVVDTKIDDANGCRNEQPLMRGGDNGRLWFFKDGSMYVYYTPTHWKERDPSKYFSGFHDVVANG